MKIVKASNGKTRITLSKKEWKEIGKTAGWNKSIKTAFEDQEGRKWSGSIQLSDGYYFYWMFDKDFTEISGHISDKNGNKVEGTYGWYREKDPYKAAQKAIDASGLDLIQLI